MLRALLTFGMPCTAISSAVCVKLCTIEHEIIFHISAGEKPFQLKCHLINHGHKSKMFDKISLSLKKKKCIYHKLRSVMKLFYAKIWFSTQEYRNQLCVPVIFLFFFLFYFLLWNTLQIFFYTRNVLEFENLVLW